MKSLEEEYQSILGLLLDRVPNLDELHPIELDVGRLNHELEYADLAPDRRLDLLDLRNQTMTAVTYALNRARTRDGSCDRPRVAASPQAGTANHQEPATSFGGQDRRRRYFTELDAQERSAARAAAVAAAGFVAMSLDPPTMSDAVLAQEREHLRTEVQLLRRELAEREQQGPRVRRVHATAPGLTDKSVLIETAMQAEVEAQRLERQYEGHERELARLRAELDNTPRRKFQRRRRLRAETGSTIQARDALVVRSFEGARAAAAAVRAIGAPRSQWSAIQFQARPVQHRMRLAQAATRDQVDLDEDRNHLWGLEHILGKVETEHTRRSALTPAQRETELQRQRAAARRPKPTQARSASVDPCRGYRRPSPGRGFER